MHKSVLFSIISQENNNEVYIMSNPNYVIFAIKLITLIILIRIIFHVNNIKLKFLVKIETSNIIEGHFDVR